MSAASTHLQLDNRSKSDKVGCKRSCNVFLPALLSPQDGQEDRGHQEGQGHLWVPATKAHSLSFYCTLALHFRLFNETYIQLV